MNKLFVFSKNKDEYTQELLLAYDRLKNVSGVYSIQEKDLSVGFMEQHKIDVVLSNGFSREWFYILQGLKCTTIVFHQVEKYSGLADIIIDYKSNDTSKYFTGETYSLINKGFDLEEIADLVSIMKWDSDFFGFNVAYLSCRNLTDSIIFKIDRFIKANNVRLIEYLCNCHDDRSVKIAEKNDFHFTDIRLTFDLLLNAKHNAVLPSGFEIKPATQHDITKLQSLTTDMYKDSRYFYDGNFDISKINEFYSSWIEKAVLGTFDKICYTLYYQGIPAGFCSVKYASEHTANIGLFGMDPAYAGKGLGKLLLQGVCDRLMDDGIKKMYVVTQGRNYSAQRLYQSVGFKTYSTQLWYHKWM